MTSNDNHLPRRIGLIIGFCFFFSGASGLIYEVVWTRMLLLVFGSTTFAVSAVLTAFMSGLALGGILGGRLIDRRGHPLRVYAILETGIAVSALAVPSLLAAATPAQRWLWQHYHPGFYAFGLTRFLLAFVVLAAPTTLMGATLPVLSKFCVRRADRVGVGVGALYAINTAGAVAGAAAAGFLLIPALGVQATTRAAVLVNLAVAWVALWLVRTPAADMLSSSTAHEEVADASLPQWVVTAALLAIGLSGCAAMTYEVAWTRALSLVIGSSVYAFTVLLCTFLLGLAAGAAALARKADAWGKDAVIALSVVQSLIGLTAFGTAWTLQHLPYWFTRLFLAWRPAPSHIVLIQFITAFILMLPPTLLLGGVFPLVLVICRHGGGGVGALVGRAYSINTVGAVAGSFAAGFVLIPTVGIRNTVLAAVTANFLVAAALCASWFDRHWGVRAGAAAVVVLLGGNCLLWAPPWDELLMSSGMYKYAEDLEDVESGDLLDAFRHVAKLDYDLLFYRDGATTTVTVAQEKGSDNIWLATNGKIDASSRSDMPTQVLSAHLPLILHPHPRDVMVVGWASGVTVGSVGLYPLQSVVCVEIEQAVIEASKCFNHVNHRPLDNPRVTHVANDARNYLELTSRRFDVIISEPSNPWLSGPSKLFTREFFGLGKSRLRPGGVFCQWVQIYGMSAPDLQCLLRTFHSEFPHVLVFATLSRADLLLLGSRQPLRIDPMRFESIITDSAIDADLQRVDVHDIFDLLSHFRLGTKELERMVGKGPLNTDDRPRIEFSAPRNLYVETRRQNLALLSANAASVGRYLTFPSKRLDDQVEFLLWAAADCAAEEQDVAANAIIAQILELDRTKQGKAVVSEVRRRSESRPRDSE